VIMVVGMIVRCSFGGRGLALRRLRRVQLVGLSRGQNSAFQGLKISRRGAGSEDHSTHRNDSLYPRAFSPLLGIPERE